eukprot:1058720-Rhodomonas_salina.1
MSRDLPSVDLLDEDNASGNGQADGNEHGGWVGDWKSFLNMSGAAGGGSGPEDAESQSEDSGTGGTSTSGREDVAARGQRASASLRSQADASECAGDLGWRLTLLKCWRGHAGPSTSWVRWLATTLLLALVGVCVFHGDTGIRGGARAVGSA